MVKIREESSWRQEIDLQALGSVSDFQMFKMWPSVRIKNLTSPPVGRMRENATKRKHSLTPSPDNKKKDDKEDEPAEDNKEDNEKEVEEFLRKKQMKTMKQSTIPTFSAVPAAPVTKGK